MRRFPSCLGTSILVSQIIFCPSMSSTQSCVSSKVTGITLPRTSNISDNTSTASSKLHVISANPVRRRLPIVCPFIRLLSKRCSNIFRTRSVSFARAAIARLASPGGRIPNSSRSSHVLPPLSEEVTIAARLACCKCLSQRRTLVLPVPPQMVVILQMEFIFF